jgi:hypothetical protein
MAEDKPTTPEQQLLKLIEGQGKPGQPGVAPAPSAGPRPKGRAFAPGRLFAWLAFWKRRRAQKRPRAGASFGLAEVNKALIAAALLLTVYVVFDAAASARNLQKPTDFAPMKELSKKAVTESVPPLAETSYYLQKVSSRDIFKEGKIQEAPEPEAPEAPVEIETAEAVQNLALVGISWSSNPDAIIEDKSKQRTYFVKRGQEVGDGVKVEAIFKEHVVVTFEDREYELR